MQKSCDKLRCKSFTLSKYKAFYQMDALYMLAEYNEIGEELLDLLD